MPDLLTSLFSPLLTTYFLNRTRKDVILPLGSQIIIKGNKVSELFIPKNTNIIVSILAVNRDVDIWGPDAGEWKPERWLAPLPENVINAGIPGVYANTCVTNLDLWLDI